MLLIHFATEHGEETMNTKKCAEVIGFRIPIEVVAPIEDKIKGN